MNTIYPKKTNRDIEALQEIRLTIIPMILIIVLLSSCGKRNMQPNEETFTPSFKSGDITYLSSTLTPSSSTRITGQGQDRGYIACNINTSESVHQLLYKGVQVGITSEESLVALWGQPDSIEESPLGEHWLYWNSTIIIKNGIVIEISVEPYPSHTLSASLSALGCPDMIYVLEFGEHPQGDPNAAKLVYLRSGLEILIIELPVHSSTPEYLHTYFLPIDKETYEVERRSRETIQIEWDELVNWGQNEDK